MKWTESGFRPPLCTYRLNWARRTSWGWWDDWDDTVLQTQDSKFKPWRSEAEHATSRSRRLPTILTFTRGWGRNIFVSLKPPRQGTEPRTLAWKAAVLTTTLGPPPNLFGKSQLRTGFRRRLRMWLKRDIHAWGIRKFRLHQGYTNNTQLVWLMHMNLCLDLESGMTNYIRFFLVHFWKRYSVLPRLSFSLEPVIQASTPIK